MAKKNSEIPTDQVEQNETNQEQASVTEQKPAGLRKSKYSRANKRKGRSARTMSSNPSDVVSDEASAELVKRISKGLDSLSADKMVNRGLETKSRSEVLHDARTRNYERGARAEEIAEQYGAWSSLESSMKDRTILRGTIVGIAPQNLRDEKTGIEYQVAMLSIIYHGLKIQIPFNEMYRDSAIDYSTIDLTTVQGCRDFYLRQKAMAFKMYGVEVPFIITGMSGGERFDGEEDYAILASRAAALNILERANFGTKFTEGKYKVGDFITAVVLSIGSTGYGLYVNAGGIDTIISTHNLTYRYIDSGESSLGNLYHVGDKLRVQIKSIKTQDDGRHVIEVTAKPAELEAAKRVQRLAPIGTETLGTITLIHPSKRYPGKSIVNIYLDAYNIPAYTRTVPSSKTGAIPRPGDKVRVRIMSYLENGMASCKLEGYHGNQHFTFNI